MNKIKNSLVLMFFISCFPQENMLPESTGNKNEILFVIEDFLWEGEKGDIIKRVFAKEIYGINQPEELFSLIQINKKQFNTILKRHRNIIIIDEQKKVLKEEEKWAKNQLIYHLGILTKETNFIKECEKISSVFQRRELLEIRTEIKQKYFKEATKKIKTKFNIDIIIPKEYVIIKDSSNFFWAGFQSSNSKKDEIKQLLVYSFSKRELSLQKQIISKTNQILKTYLKFHSKGVKHNEYVEIYQGYPIIKEGDIYRGFWEMTGNTFMGGSLLLKHYIQEEKIVVVAVIIYAPQQRKRKHIKTIEAII